MRRLAQHQTVTVFLRGDFDLARGDEIATRVARAADSAAAGRVDVDLADVTFFDCYSLGQLLRAYRLAARRGVRVRAVHPGPVVRYLVEATGTAALLNVG